MQSPEGAVGPWHPSHPVPLICGWNKLPTFRNVSPAIFGPPFHMELLSAPLVRKPASPTAATLNLLPGS